MDNIRKYFTSGEVTRLTGVSYRRLDLWCRRRIVLPSKRRARGRGQRRLFTFCDVVEVQTIKTLIDRGMRLTALEQSIKQLRRDLMREGILSFTSVRLITDGKKLLRYIPRENHLESLSIDGQFAFAFGLGDEIETLINRVKQLGCNSRYSHRNHTDTGKSLTKYTAKSS
ncbi:MAG: MerR family transcriptional regulator [Candidatus Thiodiazotropha sp. (ex Lucina pensylvanica)]|nr:MerR family transcriptional regulator [Candidatus Thiodiazotropha sp. (ex Lucina pensylvanica)]